jgi:peroxiredoxin
VNADSHGVSSLVTGIARTTVTAGEIPDAGGKVPRIKYLYANVRTMIQEGDEAPQFELPAVRDGAFETIALADYLGDNVVILAFYPGAFNPACSSDGSGLGLDDLDLFTMQKDVSIFGISGDSVYSHRRFAEEYNLTIPLLSDTRGRVAEAYGVAVEDPTAGYRTNRAVVVVDPGGEVAYVWMADDITELPEIDAVRRAVENVGGDDTARARYRIGHAHYVEGRRTFTSAMGAFEDKEWMMAKNDFSQAREEFEEAADNFDSAVRFGENEISLLHYECAEAKAEALWQAAEWLAGSASAFASGEGAEAQSMREDAERPLETARDLQEPPDPDDFPLEEPPGDGTREPSDRSFLPGDDGPADASLGTDVDTPAATAEPDEDSSEAGSGTEQPAEPEQAPAGEVDGCGEEADDDIDDEELEEITAELEAQSAKAQAERDDPAATDDRSGAEDTSAEGADTAEDTDEEIELDLTDPTGEEANGDEDESEADGDLGDDSHGVPDTL